MQRRYDRWIVEDKLYALETLAAASSRLPPDVIDLKDIHLAIVKIFCKFAIMNKCYFVTFCICKLLCFFSNEE